MQKAIAINNLTVHIDQRTILSQVHATIEKGSMVGIIGPNGAGKSTLLKSMVGLIKPQTGSIRFFGKPFRQQALNIAYIPQRFDVDWHFPITVQEVVLMGRYGHMGWFKRPKQHDYDLVHYALKQVDMSCHAARPIAMLSGGQQQRVFIARALVQQPSIYLLDEPLVGIDAATEDMIITLLKTEKKLGKTICMVHHDLQSITDYFDSLLVIENKQIASGSTHELAQSYITQQTATNVQRYHV